MTQNDKQTEREAQAEHDPASRQTANEGEADAASAPDSAQRAGGGSPHLDEEEQDQAAEHTAPHALVIHEVVRCEGEMALARPLSGLAWSALAAGLSMGFSFLALAVLRAHIGESDWTTLVASLGYSTGFIIVVLGKQQLFTESTLTVVLPVLTRRDLATFGAALRVWGIVIVMNLIGTALFAGLLTIPDLFSPRIVEALRRVGIESFGGSFGVTAVKGLLAGWLIALMVWLLPGAGPARPWIIILLTYMVSVFHLPHMIAGSVEAAYAVFTGAVPPLHYLTHFMLPTALGNVIGGISLVGMLNHATIAPEIRARAGESD